MSLHFTLDEMVASYVGTRHGIDNTPPKEILPNLDVTMNGLEQLRTLFDCPIRVLSGYRCPKLNALVGGAKTSAHMQGYAADIVCSNYSPQKMQELLRNSGIKVDQCIEEGTWLHVSFAPTMRNEYLKATFKNGKATYTKV